MELNVLQSLLFFRTGAMVYKKMAEKDDVSIHESIIGSKFTGRIEEELLVAD